MFMCNVVSSRTARGLALVLLTASGCGTGKGASTTGSGGGAGLATGGAQDAGAGGASSTGGAMGTGTPDAAEDGSPSAGGTGGVLDPGGGGVDASTGTCNTPPPPAGPLIGWASVEGNGVVTTTGGGTATPITVATLEQLNGATAGAGAAVIYLGGSVTGDVVVGSNKTIVGVCGGQITGHIHMNGSVNVILRNMKILGYNCTDSPTDCSAGADGITVVNGAHHIWFDHLDISDGSDGNLDITQASDFVTVSWTKFYYSGTPTTRRDTGPMGNGRGGHRFSNLIGASDNNPMDVGHLNVTFHHDWWADNVNERMPRMRYGKIHVFNSLYTSVGDVYCIGVGMAASVLDEQNVFIGVAGPVDTARFSDAASTVNSMANIYTGVTVAAAPDVGTAFAPPYNYAADLAPTVESAVRAGTGPQQ